MTTALLLLLWLLGSAVFCFALCSAATEPHCPVENCWPRRAIFNCLYRSLQNELDAADISQETFVKVYMHRATFLAGRKFSTWLYALASNLVRDRYRWRSRHPQVSLDAEPEGAALSWKDNLEASGPAPDAEVQNDERAASVRQAIASLPADFRQPLVLAVYEGLPHAGRSRPFLIVR